MGIFDIFSSNYKPKDFAGKTPEQIFTDIKLDKFSKSIKNVNDPEYMALDEEVKNAIDLLIDLKDGKLEIYKKCYKGKSEPIAHMPSIRPARPSRPASLPKPVNVVAKHDSIKREPIKREPIKHEPFFKPDEPAQPAQPAEPAEPEGQMGGRGRKNKKTYKRKHSKKGKKHGKTAQRKRNN